MGSPHHDLVKFITDSGISRGEAEQAAHRCELAIARGFGIGYGTSGAVIYYLSYFLSVNPVAAMSYVVTGAAVGAGYALRKSPDCDEVRSAVQYWLNGPTQF